MKRQCSDSKPGDQSETFDDVELSDDIGLSDDVAISDTGEPGEDTGFSDLGADVGDESAMSSSANKHCDSRVST